MQRLERDVVWNLVPVALLAVVGLGLNFVIGGVWGAAGLGVFNQVSTAYMVFAVLGSGCLQYSVLRAVAAHAGDPAAVAAIAVGGLVPVVGLAGVTTLAFVALHGPIAALLDSPAVGRGMLWAAPGLFCFSVNKVLLAVTNGLGRMRAFAIYVSARYLLIGAALGVAVALRVEVTKLPVLWSITEGALLVVLAGDLVMTVALRRAGDWRGWARQHGSYGARGVLATLAFEVNQKLDVWMVGMAFPDRIVGIYAMAATIAEGALQVPVAVQNTVNPPIAAALAEGTPAGRAAVEALVRRTRRWFVPLQIAACALGAVAFPIVIPWLAHDPAFAAGAVPFAILMTGIALAAAWLPFNQALLMGSRPGWHTALVGLTLATNFAANLLLVPTLGLAGAALAAALALVLSAVLLRLLARRLLAVTI